MACSDCVLNKGNVLRLLKWTLYIAALIALAILAFPISVAKAHTKTQPQLIFKIDPTLREPKVVYRPYVEEFKPKPKPKQVVQAAPKIKKANTTQQGFDPCNCVSYVRAKTGVNTGVIGVAMNHPINSQVCKVGSIIVTYESARGRKTGHVGIVAGCDEKYVTIDDYNYKRCGHTIRKLPLNSKLIKGYYHI